MKKYGITLMIALLSTAVFAQEAASPLAGQWEGRDSGGKPIHWIFIDGVAAYEGKNASLVYKKNEYGFFDGDEFNITETTIEFYPDKYGYSISGDTLTLVKGRERLILTRIKGGSRITPLEGSWYDTSGENEFPFAMLIFTSNIMIINIDGSGGPFSYTNTQIVFDRGSGKETWNYRLSGKTLTITLGAHSMILTKK